MSSKLLYSLTDENPDLQKQIGCMNGIFRLFNRHHIPTGRRINGHNHRRLPSGQSANHGKEPHSARQKTTTENQEEVVKEKQRVSVESTRTSFSSSSCSSTFSSVDCNKTSQLEPSSSGQSNFPETPPSRIIPVKQPNSSSHLSPQCADLRDIVKDSMYREARGLLVKTMAKEDGTGRVMKHIDSPRPLQQPKSVETRVAGFDGSIRVPSKLRETPRHSREGKDGSLLLAPKDAPRFSYDGRESRDAMKSTIKLKELPRLSLDSRQGSMRSSASELKSNHLLRDRQRGNGNFSQILNLHQEPGSNKRPSGIVAKLMGLEAFPDSISTTEGQMVKIKSCLDEDFDTISRSSKLADESKQIQVFGSPRVSHKDSILPQLRNAKQITKPTSRFPIEPAPWRQPDKSRSSQKPAFKYREAPTKAPHVAPSVYGEIEKRLTALEFKKSGKDLRALKQILEAIQKTRVSLENNEEKQASIFESQTDKSSPSYRSFDQISRLEPWQSQQSHHQVSPTIKGTCPPKGLESPIVIMKPAKVTEKSRISGSSMIPIDGISGLRKLRTGQPVDDRKVLVDKRPGKDLTPRNSHLRDPSSRPLACMDKQTNARTLRSMQTSKATQHMTEENLTSSRRSSGTVSPRLQQKRHGMEKQFCPPTPSSDLSRARRQSSKQPIESGSLNRRLKPKFTNLQQGDNQSSEISAETRNSSHQGDTVSVQSESNISLASQNDTEVTSPDRSIEITGTYQQKDHKDKNPAARFSEHKSMAELVTATLEQPSPVSVLDATFYREDSPSPVKKISNAFKDDETQSSDEAEWNPADLDHLLSSTRPNLSSEFNHKNIENIEHLVHKLRLLNSTDDEATMDHTASLCENTNPDRRYIAEIFLASGLPQNLSSSLTTIQLHTSGHLIHPDLFHVLEQIKGSIELANDEPNERIARSKFNDKMQRKLLFDVVNEILVHKFALAGSSELRISPNKLAGRSLSRQKLLKELYSEMEHLQAQSDCSLDDEDHGLISADIMHQLEDWADYRDEFQGLVLDIERLIFKDLVSEVVSGEAAGLQDRPRRHCKQLFSN